MTKNKSKFFIDFTIFSVVIAALSIGIDLLTPSIAITKTWPWVLIILYFFTLISFYFQSNFISKKISSFANAFMLINFGRLILFSVIIVCYSILHHSDAILFALTFFLYYLIFTTFEIVAIFRLQKKIGRNL